MNRLAIVVNPAAGSGRALKMSEALRRAFAERSVEVALHLTKRAGHAPEIIRELLKTEPGVAVVGGDGTFNEAVQGFYGEEHDPESQPTKIAQDRWLAPLPCGTGGDFRRTLGYPEGVDALAQRLLQSEPTPLDIGWLRFADYVSGERRSRMFLNVVSCGLGGEVDAMVERIPAAIKGKLSYIGATIAAGLPYRPVPIEITTPETARETTVVNFAIANGQYFGAGMQIAPSAELRDGFFELVSLERTSILSQIGLLPRLYDGSLLEQSGVWHAQASEVSVRSRDGRNVRIDLDGEACGKLPLAATMMPGDLWIR